MINAKKLTLQFPTIDLENLELIEDKGEFRHVLFENRAGVTRYKLPDITYESVLNCLPEAFQSFVFCINFSMVQSAVPHFHTYDTSVVNYYINTDDYETVFYETSNKSINVEECVEFPQEELIQVVDISSVNPIEKFIAKSGDAYVLNSRAIHSVSQLENNLPGYDRYRPVKEESRSVIQIWTRCPFNLACRLLP